MKEKFFGIVFILEVLRKRRYFKMTIETICTRCIKAVTNAGYSDATIFNYKGVIRRFKTFCSERGVTDYSSEIGKQYAADVISKKTGKFSLNRCHTQGRFFRQIDSYNRSGLLIFLCKSMENTTKKPHVSADLC